jgi:hypothetical protein
MAVQRARLCIVSRDPLRGGEFIAALQESLDSEDTLEIIVDRRRDESPAKPGLKEDRRSQRQVALSLRVHGFAIVPASVNPPIERFLPAEDDEARLESIRSFQSRHPGGLIPRVIGVVTGVVVVVGALLLVGQLRETRHSSRPVTGSPSGRPDQPPGQSSETPAQPQIPAFTEVPKLPELPPAPQPKTASPSVGAVETTRPGSPRDADRLTPRPRETSGPSEVTGTASQELIVARGETSLPPRETSASPKETSAPPNETSSAPKETSAPPKESSTSTPTENASADEAAATPQPGNGTAARDARPETSAPARPSRNTAPQSNQVARVPSQAETPKATPPQSVGSPRVELVGGPVPRGWGDSYAVRVSDPEGKPIVDATVLLVARMRDGTVENVAMGALAEPGMYRGTVPTTRSTPVDLEVRVTTGGKSMDVPLNR